MVSPWKPTSPLICTCFSCEKSLLVCIFNFSVQLLCIAPVCSTCGCTVRPFTQDPSPWQCTLDPSPVYAAHLRQCTLRVLCACTLELDPAPSVDAARQISLFHAAAPPGKISMLLVISLFRPLLQPLVKFASGIMKPGCFNVEQKGNGYFHNGDIGLTPIQFPRCETGCSAVTF